MLKDIVSGSSNSRINVSFHTTECLVKLLTIVTVQVKKFHSKSTFARLDWKFYVSSWKNSDFCNSIWCSQLKLNFLLDGIWLRDGRRRGETMKPMKTSHWESNLFFGDVWSHETEKNAVIIYRNIWEILMATF